MRFNLSILFVAVATLMLYSCGSKEENGQQTVPQDLTFTAYFLEAGNNSAAKTTWNIDDNIDMTVLSGTNVTQKRLTATKIGSDGKSATFPASGISAEADVYFAVLPGTGAGSYKAEKQFTTGSMNNFSGMLPTVTVALGQKGQSRLTFRNIFGLLSFQVTNTTVRRVELTGNNGEILDREHLISLTDLSLSESPSPAFEPRTGLSLNVTGSGVYYFGLYPGLNLSGGYTISAYDEAGELVATASSIAPLSIKGGELALASSFTDYKPVDPDKPVIFDETKVAFSFGAVSDVHIGTTSGTEAGKFISALQQLKSRAAERDSDGLDALVVAGDLTENAYIYSSHIIAFKTLYERELDPKEVPMIYTVGNHDAGKNVWWDPEVIALCKGLSSSLGDNYFLTDQDDEMRKNFECRDCLVNGYHVLCITPIGVSPVIYSPNTVQWLDQRLKALTDAHPNQFVFVNTHPMIDDTCYGSLLGTPTGIGRSDIWQSSNNWATSQLTEVLSRYPQAVTFGGHLHFPLNDPRSIMQTAFTSFGCGSVRYMAIENGKYEEMSGATVMKDCEQFSQGWLIQLDENGNMRATAMDFYRKRIIGEPYEIPAPKEDKSHLALFGKDRAEKNTPPVLSSLEIVQKNLGATTTVSAEFAAGQDDEFVHHYVVSLKKDGNVFTTKKILADFYLCPQPSDMKKKWTVNLGSVTAGSYEVSVTGYDSWDGESSPLTKAFSIDTQSQTVEASVYADIDFTGGTLSDSKGKLTFVNNGATIGKTNVSFGGTDYSVDALNASSEKYATCTFEKITSSDEMKAFMANGFSVEAFFVDKEPGGDGHGIVCGTEQGGWGLATRPGGQPYFIIGEDSHNTYKYIDAKAAASTKNLTHVIGVYDVTNRQLRLYINGLLDGQSSITGSYYNGAGDTFNRFCLGADIKKDSGTDYPNKNTIIVDAKLYLGALDHEGAKKAYEAAVAALK